MLAGAGWLVGLAAVAGGLLLLPGTFGVGLGQVALWAPDVAGLLGAGLVLVLVLALCRVAVIVRSWAVPATARGDRAGSTEETGWASRVTGPAGARPGRS